MVFSAKTFLRIQKMDKKNVQNQDFQNSLGKKNQTFLGVFGVSGCVSIMLRKEMLRKKELKVQVENLTTLNKKINLLYDKY